MALSLEETRLLGRLHSKWLAQKKEDEANDKIFEGLQRIAHLGIAVPPEVEPFAFPMSWGRTYVEAIEQRMDVRLFLRPGDVNEDEDARRTWEVNNLETESQLAHLDLLVYGRCIASVGWPDRALGQVDPVIRVESPTAFAVEVNPLTRAMTGALRVYTDDDGRTQLMTLYLPDSTVHLVKDKGKWTDEQRDVHDLGRVPVVAHWNRRRSGKFTGVSQMQDLRPWIQMAARVVLQLQLAMETVATPQKVALGLSQDDFQDEEGNPLEPWDTYLGAIWAISRGSKEGVSIEQLPAADLKGFLDVMEMIAKQVAAATGLPLRMLGHSTVNPASEGGIKADEVRLVRTIERICSNVGPFWGWLHGIAYRIRNGTWYEGPPIKSEWRNPGTPTESEEADSIVKKTGGAPVLSVRGAMNSMGYTQARIDQEMEWLDNEARGLYTLTDLKLERPAFPDPDGTTDPDAAPGEQVAGLPDPWDTASMSTLQVLPEQEPEAKSDADIYRNLKHQADALGAFIRAGVEPDNAAGLVGLDDVRFVPGATPVSLRHREDEQRRGGDE